MSTSNERTEPTLDDLLTDEERDDLDRVLESASSRYLAAACDEDVLHHLEQVYLEGRLSGLCREGALELVADAMSSLSAVPVLHAPDSSEG